MDRARRLKQQIALLDCIVAQYEDDQHHGIRTALEQVVTQRDRLRQELELCSRLIVAARS